MTNLQKPLQLVRYCWGLRQTEPQRSPLVFCHDDPTIEQLDAPEQLPSGSAIRDFLGQRESICYREPFGHAGRNF